MGWKVGSMLASRRSFGAKHHLLVKLQQRPTLPQMSSYAIAKCLHLRSASPTNAFNTSWALRWPQRVGRDLNHPVVTLCHLGWKGALPRIALVRTLRAPNDPTERTPDALVELSQHPSPACSGKSHSVRRYPFGEGPSSD